MTTLLKEPIQDEDNWFFRVKAKLTSIFVQEASRPPASQLVRRHTRRLPWRSVNACSSCKRWRCGDDADADRKAKKDISCERKGQPWRPPPRKQPLRRDVTCLLCSTKNKELLEILAPSFTSSNFSKEEGEALTREVEDLRVETEEPTIWDWGEKRENAEMWSDGECYHHQKKRLTGIQVAVEDKNSWISRVRVAFDNREWGSWRKTAYEFGTPVEQSALLLQNGRSNDLGDNSRLYWQLVFS